METTVNKSKNAESQAKPEVCTGFSKPRKVSNAILQKVGRDGVEIIIEKGELPPPDVRMEDSHMRN